MLIYTLSDEILLNYFDGVGIAASGGFPHVAILCMAQFQLESAPKVVGIRVSIVNL